eukprot:COSAG05_NODE_945_length_6487_cov_3.519568_1_plen_72_part_00
MLLLRDGCCDIVQVAVITERGLVSIESITAECNLAVASKLPRLVALSVAMPGDAAFARQAKRKFLSPHPGS